MSENTDNSFEDEITAVGRAVNALRRDSGASRVRAEIITDDGFRIAVALGNWDLPDEDEEDE